MKIQKTEKEKRVNDRKIGIACEEIVSTIVSIFLTLST